MDPIANMLSQIKNASNAGKPTVLVPFSRLKMAIVAVLEQEKYIGSAVKKGKKVRKFIEVSLRHNHNGSGHIGGIERISKPSRRVYVGARDIARANKRGRGMLVLSTPSGVVSASDARKAGQGGEVLFRIW